jgi:hypothetical protein
MQPRIMLFAMALSVASGQALAHSTKTGVNGGRQTDAGNYHVEILPNGTTLRILLRDHGDRSVSTTGFKGTAILVVNGRPQRITLAPAGENALQGEASEPLPAEPTGAVQITTPTGATVQAKF